MTRIIAHRGASAYEAENSLAAFSAAVDLGADGVELDVHATADGTLVVHHDETVGGASIAVTRYDDLRDYRLGNGEPVPRLHDVLSLLLDAVDVYVEVKSLPPSHDTALLHALANGPAPDLYHVHSFDHRIVKRLKERHQPLSTGVLSVSYPIDPVGLVEAAGADTLWQAARMVDDDLVRILDRRSLDVIAWTVDDAPRLAQLAELGVHAVCTNRPDEAREVLSRMRFH